MKLTSARASVQTILAAAAVAVTVLGSGAGCAPAHTGAYKQKKRE